MTASDSGDDGAGKADGSGEAAPGGTARGFSRPNPVRPTPLRRPQPVQTPFLALRRGAASLAPKQPSKPETTPEFETVSLRDVAPTAPTGETPERAAHRKRLQRGLDTTPLAKELGLRLDYAGSGVSRIHLPARASNTEPGPLEGAVIGTLCVTAGHFAAASVAPSVGIRLVEYKVNILGVVQGNLLAIGEVVRKGRTLVACRVEVVEDNDRVVAIAMITYLLQQS